MYPMQRRSCCTGAEQVYAYLTRAYFVHICPWYFPSYPLGCFLFQPKKPPIRMGKEGSVHKVHGTKTDYQNLLADLGYEAAKTRSSSSPTSAERALQLFTIDSNSWRKSFLSLQKPVHAPILRNSSQENACEV